jgi:hypothetical protein
MKLRQEKQMTFDKWLEWYFVEEVEEGRMALDDDLGDATDRWMETLTKEDYADLAHRYGNDMVIEYIIREKIEV